MSDVQAQKRFECEYDLTRADLYAFQWRAADRSPLAKKARRNSYLVVFGCFLVIGMLSLWSSWGSASAWWSVTSLALGFGIFALLMKLFERFATRRVLNNLLDEEEPEGGRLGHHKLVLDDSGVTESTAVGESLTRWPGIGRLEEDETYIYIYTAPGAAHVVPKRAFSSEAAASTFLEAATHWREARGAAVQRELL